MLQNFVLDSRKTSTFVSQEDGSYCLETMICSDDPDKNTPDCIPKLACCITDSLVQKLETGGKSQIHLFGHIESHLIHSMDIKSQKPLWPPFSRLLYLTLTAKINIPDSQRSTVIEHIQNGLKCICSEKTSKVNRPKMKFEIRTGEINVSVPLGLEIGWYVAESVNCIAKAQQVILSAISTTCEECPSPEYTSSITTTFSLPDDYDDAFECTEDLDH